MVTYAMKYILLRSGGHVSIKYVILEMLSEEIYRRASLKE